MNRHMRRKHDATYKDEKTLSARTICSYPNCNEEYFHKSKYIEHLSEKHHVDIQTVEKNFTNMQEFFSWKEKEESENFLYFSKQRGTSSSEIASNMYYVCQHDGHSKAHRRNKEPERKTNKRYHHGRIKRGTFCPARMNVKLHERDSTVSVTYIRAHSHPNGIENTAHQPTPTSVLNSIKTKLSLGVPVNNIYRELREGIGNRNSCETSSEVISKRHLLKKSNVSDIHRHMNYGRRLHPDDSTSTYLLVKKLQEEDFNAVLLYKPQGDKVVIGPKIYNELDVGENLFAIGLQTKQQLDMFIKHSNKIVCIDSTHETNQYEFPLVTLVVADEFNKGYPVGFFISNHAEELSLRPFLEEIKKRCPEDLKINTVMTDDDNSGWNAFSSVFGSVEHHLLCKWHITRAWIS